MTFAFESAVLSIPKVKKELDGDRVGRAGLRGGDSKLVLHLQFARNKALVVSGARAAAYF